MNLPQLPQGTNVVVGIDQIEVLRIRESLEKYGDHFLKKFFRKVNKIRMDSGSIHLSCCQICQRGNCEGIGTGFGAEFGWLDSEVCSGELGQPSLSFNKRVEILRAKRAKPHKFDPFGVVAVIILVSE